MWKVIKTPDVNLWSPYTCLCTPTRTHKNVNTCTQYPPPPPLPKRARKETGTKKQNNEENTNIPTPGQIHEPSTYYVHAALPLLKEGDGQWQSSSLAHFWPWVSLSVGKQHTHTHHTTPMHIYTHTGGRWVPRQPSG